MSIGEVARRAGVRPSAIRYYEKLGVLPRPVRVSGPRRYDDRVVERLAMVRFARHVGLSMAEIGRLLAGVPGRPPTHRWRRIARARVAEVEGAITRARAVRKLLQQTLDHT
jgi:DNA-binding transcriptional MerR regulator